MGHHAITSRGVRCDGGGGGGGVGVLPAHASPHTALRCVPCQDGRTWQQQRRHHDLTRMCTAPSPGAVALQADVLRAEAVRSREEEERGNAMKALENRTKDSKREMDIMEALDEMRSLKARCVAGSGWWARGDLHQSTPADECGCCRTCRHAGITTEQALNALQREGLGAGDDGSGSGGDDGGGDRQRAEDGAGAHRDSSDEDLPEEDRRAMAEFLAQRQTILKRLDSDDESEGRRHGGGGGGGGHDTTSKAGDAVPGPSSSTAAVKAAPQGAPRAPTIKVAVRAKRPQPNPTAGAAGDDKRHRSDAAGDAASILGGLIGGYGSSGSGSGSEDGAG